MEAMNYVKPELIVVAFVLYFFGVALRQAQAVKNKRHQHGAVCGLGDGDE